MISVTSLQRNPISAVCHQCYITINAYFENPVRFCETSANVTSYVMALGEPIWKVVVTEIQF